MAELVRIPAGNLARDTLKIPDGVTDEEASFVEPLATVVKAFRRARVSKGQSLLVVGLGPAGQLAIRLGRAAGAAQDRRRGPGGLAPRLGRRGHKRRGRGDRRLARGARGGRAAPSLRRASTSSSSVRASATWWPRRPEAVAAGGTLLLFTMAPPGETWNADLYDLYFREVTVLPSYSCGPDDTSEALARIARRRGSGRRPRVASVSGGGCRSEAFARARALEGSMKVAITF